MNLPEGLRRQFALLRRRLRRVETMEVVSLSLAVVFAAVLFLFASDRFWETPAWLRLILHLSALGVIGWALFRWLRRWIFRPLDLRDLSDLVQKRYRRLGDRLLGIVELADERKRPAHFSPELYQAAIHQVAADAAQYDFRQAVETSAVRGRAGVAATLLVLVLLLLILFPAAGWNAWMRWVTPLSQVERYTLVVLEDWPEEQVVAHGEEFELTGRVRYRSFWRPARAVGQYERQPKLRSGVEDSSIVFRVPGQVREGKFKVRVGDAERWFAVTPTHRPTLRTLTASVRYPEYLRYPAASENVQSGFLSVLEGSHVAFTGKANRVLAEAQMRIPEVPAMPLEVEGEGFVSTSISLGDALQFNWRDHLGLEAAAPWKLNIRRQRDLPPATDLPGVSRDIAILQSEVIQFRVASRDDFGVSDVGITWRFSADSPRPGRAASTEVRMEFATPDLKNVEEVFDWSPAMYRVPQDGLVELQAYSRDLYPDRERVETPVYRIRVLSNEQHAEMIRGRLDALLARLEEVTRQQEKLASATRELKDSDKLGDPKASDQIAKAQDDQMRNAANLDKLAQEGQRALREAMRNPLIPQETVRDWAGNLQQMQQLSQKEMKEAAGSLQSAQQSPSSRKDDLASAWQQQEDILKALEQMQKKVNEEIDQLQALTLAQRLRRLSQQQVETSGALQRIVPETIGMLPAELPEEFRQANALFAEHQAASHEEALSVQGEISRFYERTQRGIYGDVSKAMVQARTGEELDRIRGLIQDNINMEAMENLGDWSKRFTGWADLLEPQDQGDGSGGGGEGGGGENMANALMKQLMALLRLRAGEWTLRQQTGIAEKEEDRELQEENVQILSEAQQKLIADLGQVQKTNPLAMMEPLLEDSRQAMQQVETRLSEAALGEDTRGLQTQVIELLSDAINIINEQAKQQSSAQGSSGGAEAMEFMMQMMALGAQPGEGTEPGNSPGGGRMEGGTDRASGEMLGDAEGKGPEGRTVERGSGATQPVPVEFRQALEHYFRTIERAGGLP